MKIEKIEGYREIPNTKKVKVIKMNHLVEVMYMKNINRDGLPITKISKDEYILDGTGEIFEYEHTENRTQNKDNLRKTFKKLRHLINYNFGNSSNELAFTITYADNMKDTKQLYKDFDKFMKKIKYKYKDVDYINVVEPQGRGAWHCHVLLKFNDYKKIYIPNKEIAEYWGNGFVKVKAIKQNVDNLGAYLSAYLGDISVDEINPSDFVGKTLNIKEVEVEGVKKKIIKGGRLYLYPTGMQIYRKSRGIKEPTEEWMEYQEIKKIVGNTTPNYSQTIDIFDDECNQLNTIIYEHYNLKRSSPSVYQKSGDNIRG